jgi:hypothetical protein
MNWELKKTFEIGFKIKSVRNVTKRYMAINLKFISFLG